MTESEKVKRPASQYYWGDWWKDKGLQSCSQPARGLWHEMNTLMHEGEPYGHLTVNGKPMTIAQLANLCRITPARCKVMVDELVGAGVPSIDPATGALFSRRMVRDERVREARAAGGKAGAEHGVKGAEAGKKGGRPAGKEGGSETPLPGFENPPPSSSSSSSPSGEEKPTASSAAKLPPCPFDRIVEVYHEVLPELPRVRLMTEPRKRALQSMWKFVLTSKRKEDGSARATNADEAIDWIREYFTRARDNDFLMGRTRRTGTHANWVCDLDFLLTDKGKHHVIEKTAEPGDDDERT